MTLEEYKLKYGPTLDEADQFGTISANERSPENLWGLGDALTQARALLTGAHTPIESGLETPTFLEPVSDWMSNVPITGAGIASSLIPATRGEVIGETIPLAAGGLSGLASQPGGVGGQLAGLVRGGSHPTWAQRAKNLGEDVVESIFVPSKRPTASLPTGIGGKIPPPSRMAAPKAAGGSWTRAGEDLAEWWGKVQKPNTTGSLTQELGRSVANLPTVLAEYLSDD